MAGGRIRGRSPDPFADKHWYIVPLRDDHVNKIRMRRSNSPQEYSDRKNDEEDEHVADSLLYDRSHLPRTIPAPQVSLPVQIREVSRLRRPESREYSTDWVCDAWGASWDTERGPRVAVWRRPQEWHDAGRPTLTQSRDTKLVEKGGETGQTAKGS